jgi:hypothetical protein
MRPGRPGSLCVVWWFVLGSGVGGGGGGALYIFVTRFRSPHCGRVALCLPTFFVWLPLDRSCVRAMLVAEMLRPQSLALEYARHVGVLTESPDVLRSTLVIHRFHSVLAGWEGEPADQEVGASVESPMGWGQSGPRVPAAVCKVQTGRLSASRRVWCAARLPPPPPCLPHNLICMCACSRWPG